MFLFCSNRWNIVRRVRSEQQGKREMFCERCGETMRPETTIKLRRSFGRVRARHFPGAYCASCKARVSTEDHAAVVPQASASAWLRLPFGQRSGLPTGMHA
jgi:hypothetical protein